MDIYLISPSDFSHHLDRDVKQHQGSDFLPSIKHNKERSQSCFQGFNLVTDFSWGLLFLSWVL